MTQIFFSQCIAVLCSEAPGLAELRLILEREGYTIKADEDTSEWPEMQGEGLTLATNFENGATCCVDICDFPWPDDMGVTGDPTLVTGAHMMGAFGPFAHPGAFERALQAPGYQSAPSSTREHRAFVRFRVSNLIPASEESAEARFASAENANPAWEIAYLLRVAASLREMPVALAYFNPSSELLLSMEGMSGILGFAFEHKTYPVEAVCRVRGCKVDEEWSLVDSIGMEQLGLRDHEFTWAGAEVSRQEQVEFLINLQHYQIDHSAPMTSGHTTDGPHDKLWRAEERENACMMPPRRVLHWTIDGDLPEPAPLAATATAAPVASNDESGLSPEAEEILSKLEAWLPLRDSIRARAVNWVCSPAFRTVYYDDAHVPLALKYALEQEVSKKESKELWQKIQFLGIQNPQLWNQYQQLASQGQVWFAVPMMTNPAFNTEPNAMLPCGVIVATEQTSMEILLAGVFAMVAYELYSGGGDKTRHPGTARMMADDNYRMFYRETFPLEETQGSQFTLLSILLRKSWMPPDGVPFIPLLVMPGPKGAVVQIPWHIACGSPPPPGSMKPGRFAEISEVDRLADRMVAGQKTKKRGCWDVISLVVTAFFVAGIIGGLCLMFLENPKDRKSAPKAQTARRQTFSNVSSWSQTPSLREQASVVNATAYPPLLGEDAAGSGFLFKIEAGFILAATSRHQFANPDQPPGKLFDLDELEVSLNKEQFIRQPDSQIQLVNGLSKFAPCLEYHSSDILRNGDMLRLILGKGKWVEGRLQTEADVPLSSPSALLRLQVQTNESVAGTSGSPIVHAQTGRVVGVMIGADKAQSPKVLAFETLRIVLVAKKIE